MRLKGTLRRVKLGNYIWDDFLIFVAEVCKGIEVLEIRSDTITDAAIAHLLKRAERLTALDIS
jgi:hypothetical protein